MEKDEKALLEELKFFDMNNLYQKGSYIDFNFQNYWFQAYILKVRANNKYDISFLYNPSDTKEADEINSKFFGFFGEHSYKLEMGCRNICFNRELYENDIKQTLQKFKLKLKKSNLDFDFENKDKKKVKNKEIDNNNNGQSKEIKNNDNKNDNNLLEEKEKNEIKDIQNKNNEENDKNQSENKNEIKENNSNIKIENDVNKNLINEPKISDDNNNIKDNQEKNETQITNEKEKKEKETITNTTESTTIKNIQNENQIDESTTSSENNNNINISKDKEQNKSEINNNSESKNNEKAKVVPTSLTKLDKNGNPVNISGYYTFQLLGGYLIDCSILIKHNLNPRIYVPFFKDLFELCLDTIIFIANTVLQHMGKLKTLMSNRKLIILSQTYAILASFELVLNNFAEFYQYELGNKYQEIVEKFKIFANICYNILIESQKISALPLNLLINLIKFLSEEEVNCNIKDYDENKVFKVFLTHIEHLTENELKNIKSNEIMKKKCFETVNMIFKKKKIEVILTSVIIHI